MNLTDYEIVKGIRNGSEENFIFLYNKYFTPLCRFSFHIVMREESKDIVHDIFTKLWECRKTLPIDTNIKSYLFSAVKNKSLDYLKHLGIEDKNSKLVTEALIFLNEDWSDEKEELYSKIDKSIDQLPTAQATIIKLKLEGKSYQEIANILNISVKTVNNQIIKAYSYIRNNTMIISTLINLTNFLLIF